MQFSSSAECSKSELDIFSVPPTNTAIEEGQWDTIQPHPNFDKSPVIRYDITGTNSHYIDLSSTELHLKFQIKDSAEMSPTTLDTDVAVVNNFLHSIFEQCQVYLNNVAVENTNKCYNYRAYMENTLCYGKEAKETFLSSDWYHIDTSTAETFQRGNSVTSKQKYILNDQGDDTTSTTTPKAKVKIAAKNISLCGKIHCDIFNINRYLLNNIDVKIVLSKAKKDFFFYGTPADCSKFKFEITETYLKIRRVRISSAVMLAHAMALEKTTAKYPIKRVLLKPFIYPSNSSIFTISGIHFGIMPTRVVFGVIRTDAFNGLTELNPYHFTDIGINRLNLKVASKPLPYSSGLSFKYAASDYLDGYLSLFKNIRESSNAISYEDYKNGNVFYAFDLSPDLCSAEHFNLLKDGALELDVNMDKALATSYTFLFYLEFDNIIEITKERQVLVDYKL